MGGRRLRGRRRDRSSRASIACSLPAPRQNCAEGARQAVGRLCVAWHGCGAYERPLKPCAHAFKNRSAELTEKLPAGRQRTDSNVVVNRGQRPAAIWMPGREGGPWAPGPSPLAADQCPSWPLVIRGAACIEHSWKARSRLSLAGWAPHSQLPYPGGPAFPTS